MQILYLLIPLGLILVGGALWVFFWAVQSGQFEDLEGPAYRIFEEEDNESEIPSPRLGERE
jgi:cbb3-type cytochrome oxidase maturation protein